MIESLHEFFPFRIYFLPSFHCTVAFAVTPCVTLADNSVDVARFRMSFIVTLNRQCISFTTLSPFCFVLSFTPNKQTKIWRKIFRTWIVLSFFFHSFYFDSFVARKKVFNFIPPNQHLRQNVLLLLLLLLLLSFDAYALSSSFVICS